MEGFEGIAGIEYDTAELSDLGVIEESFVDESSTACKVLRHDTQYKYLLGDSSGEIFQSCENYLLSDYNGRLKKGLWDYMYGKLVVVVMDISQLLLLNQPC